MIKFDQIILLVESSIVSFIKFYSITIVKFDLAFETFDFLS